MRARGFADLVEFLDISRAVGVGFLVMGFIGFAVKLIHIPINNILVLASMEETYFRWGERNDYEIPDCMAKGP